MNARRRAFGGWAYWHAAWALMWGLSAVQDAWLGIEGPGSWLRIGAAIVDGIACWFALGLLARCMRQRALGQEAWRQAMFEALRAREGADEIRWLIETFQRGPGGPAARWRRR